MKSSLPKLIFITGADGAGKSCLSQWLVERLQKKGIRTKIIWSRFNNCFSKPLLAFTRLTGHNYYKTIDGIRFGFHDFENLHVYRHVFAMMQAIDVNIAAYRNIRRAKEGLDVLVCERGPWDTLVDVSADTGFAGLPDSRLGKFYTRQVIHDAKVLLISRSKDNIFRTRPELLHDNKLDMRIAIYHQLAEVNGWSVVDNNRSLVETKTQISGILNLDE